MSPCSRADKKFLVLPVSVSSVPEETQRVLESGTQRAGRGAGCDTPAPSPASRGGAPGRMSGVWSAGWQRAGRGDAILRLQVQHPAMQWSFRENAEVANNTQQDKITGEVVMI